MRFQTHRVAECCCSDGGDSEKGGSTASKVRLSDTYIPTLWYMQNFCNMWMPQVPFFSPLLFPLCTSLLKPTQPFPTQTENTT